MAQKEHEEDLVDSDDSEDDNEPPLPNASGSRH